MIKQRPIAVNPTALMAENEALKAKITAITNYLEKIKATFCACEDSDCSAKRIIVSVLGMILKEDTAHG